MRRRLIGGMLAAGVGLALLVGAIGVDRGMDRGQVSAAPEACNGCFSIQFAGFDDNGCLRATVMFWNDADRVAIAGACGAPAR